MIVENTVYSDRVKYNAGVLSAILANSVNKKMKTTNMNIVNVELQWLALSCRKKL